MDDHEHMPYDVMFKIWLLYRDVQNNTFTDTASETTQIDKVRETCWSLRHSCVYMYVHEVCVHVKVCAC